VQFLRRRRHDNPPGLVSTIGYAAMRLQVRILIGKVRQVQAIPNGKPLGTFLELLGLSNFQAVPPRGCFRGEIAPETDRVTMLS
jgi:hypothetical protein